jgi:hypothetical protein
MGKWICSSTNLNLGMGKEVSDQIHGPAALLPQYYIPENTSLAQYVSFPTEEYKQERLFLGLPSSLLY